MSRVHRVGVVAGSRLNVDPYGGASIVLDFAGEKNGGVPFYRVDGVQYASAAAAGFTGTGTFSASGYTAAGTESISGTVGIPGDFIVFARFVDSPTSGTRLLFEGGLSGNLQVGRTDTSYVTVPVVTLSPTTASAVAYGRSGGVAKASFDGGAVTTAGAFPVLGTGAFTVGNNASGGNPWAAPIKLITIHKSTLSDAQIQALGA